MYQSSFAASRCLFIVTLFASTLVRAQDPKPDPVKAEVQAVYDAIATAFQKEDLAGVTKFSLPTATMKRVDGKELTLDEWKQSIPFLWSVADVVKSKITVDEVMVEGETASVRYHEDHDLVVTSKAGEPQQKFTYASQWRSTLKKTKDGWRISRSEEREQKVVQDGKVVKEVKEVKAAP